MEDRRVGAAFVVDFARVLVVQEVEDAVEVVDRLDLFLRQVEVRLLCEELVDFLLGLQLPELLVGSHKLAHRLDYSNVTAAHLLYVCRSI